MSQGLSRKPILAVLTGDPAGVGPEMAVKLLAHAANAQAADVVLVSTRSALAGGELIARLPLKTVEIASLDELRFTPGRITHWVQPGPPPPRRRWGVQRGLRAPRPCRH